MDFQTKGEFTLDLTRCEGFARVVAQKLQAELKQEVTTWYLVMKDKGYWAKIKGENVFKTSFHLYFARSRVSLADSKRFRTFCIERVREHFGCINYINSESDVVDQRIPLRTNGLMMVSDFKPGAKGGRYAVKVAASLHKGKFIEDYLTKEKFLSEFGDYLDDMYGFVWEGPDKGWVSPVNIPN